MLRLQRRILDGLLKGSQRQGYLFGTQKTAVKEHSNDHHDHHDHHEHDSHDDHDDHHHHDKPYDWRDDFAQNLEYQQDILNRGVPDPKTYHYPYESPPRQWRYSHPANYDPKNLSQNLSMPSHTGPIINKLRAPETTLQEDIAHEYDYESEDLDFQAETFHSQHFRKKGHMWMWAVVAVMPVIFWSCEFFFQKFPDEDYWRFQRPPPLECWDEDDTPDRETERLFHTPEFKWLYEAGILVPPFFKIEDDKKIYFPEAGVNQPMDVI